MKFLLTHKNVTLIAATWDELQILHKLKPFFGFKIYCSSHGTDITKHVFPRKEKTLRKINTIFGSIDLFMPVSQSLDRLARSMYPNILCKSIVLGCNVNTERFHPEMDTSKKSALRKQFNIDPSRSLIITVGRMMAVKGFRQVIMALPEIRKTIPDVLYMIVAEPQAPEHQQVQYLVKELDLEDHVVIQNPVSNDELPKLLQMADVFTLTSEPVYYPHYQEEGLPRVIPEASACGLPVIVSTTGGLKEAVIDKETGFVVRHGDQETLKKRLITLLNDENLASEMGRKGREHVIKNFSDQAMIEKILDIVNL
ncbi:glycosyltransferase family 4 protein [Prosthecochloris sp. SCSIO W1101]|uniref:glycosyltransferase family 4 protein n=1 Tax=Prosthecochloris sp. SCSIO W1101 TaxID=2992242 RepID=UPI00223D88E2|nr:glycosyltransferase family 4 protein [Prosthecochloris sp. SCSIO W1101]UZJ41098.1 glycosyltransferase family 4 protein [Prosthecochloris sp. SCSIO W1101]